MKRAISMFVAVIVFSAFTATTATAGTPSLTLADVSVGGIVSFDVNGQPTEFIVVQQGSPSAMYRGFEDGTVLTRRYTLEYHMSSLWHSANNNDYENSDVHTWLNNQFVNSIEPGVRSQLQTVRIPFRPGVSPSETIASGANGLQCQAFLLSRRELGMTLITGVVDDGVAFSHFEGGWNRVALGRSPTQSNNMVAVRWWTRSPHATGETVIEVSNTGAFMGTLPNTSNIHVRPTLVLPNTMSVDADGRVHGEPPEPPVTTPPTSTEPPDTSSEPPELTIEPAETTEETTAERSQADDSAFSPEQWALIENHIVWSRIALVVGTVVLVFIALYKFLRIFI
jgi:hypothetical protein